MQSSPVGFRLTCLALLSLCACDDATTSTLDGSALFVDGGASDGPGGDVTGVDTGAGDHPPDTGMLSVDRPMRREFSMALAQQLKVPPGFTVSVFARNLVNPRWPALGPDGSLYVTVPSQGQVVRLLDGNGDGDADDPGERVVAASKMDNPDLAGVHGIAVSGGKVYLASVSSVFSATPGPDGKLTGLTKLIGDLPDGGQHPNRTLAVGPDGKLYVTVGSLCNNCPGSESEPGTFLRVETSGAATANPPNPQHPLLAHNPMAMVSPRIYASGLRNTLGFDWHPTTQQLWGFDQGSDGLGDDLPPEELNWIQGGRAYGWPYCWNTRLPDPTADDPSPTMTRQAYCPNTEPSVEGYQAHSSPIGFLFYNGAQFPAAYRGDAFVAFRGSWNRTTPTGYKVVRVHFENGKPAPLPGATQPFEDFLTGFLIEGGAAHFGRIAGLAIDATGALIVAEDTNGIVYRVSYGGGTDGGAPDAPVMDAGALDAPAGN
jgi:glucose/arabinose dehydrogenase